MSGRRVLVTGATGLIGRRLVAALLAEGAEVTVLSRDPEGARETLGEQVQALAWDLLGEPAPAAALEGREAVMHLAGEPVSQRWSAQARRSIHDSRVLGTRNLVAGLRSVPEPPGVLVCSSAIGYYGAHGEEPIDEEAPAGRGFLAQVCAEWEAEAQRAATLAMRVVCVRTGVVLDRSGGALASMLAPFKLGVGGPVAGGRQYISWIHSEDLVAMMLTAIADPSWSGAVNATAPDPVTNTRFSRTLGRVLSRPAIVPVPGLVLRARFGEMAEIITTGARVVPARPLMLGYEFRHPELEGALRSALAR